MLIEMGSFDIPFKRRGGYVKVLNDFLSSDQPCLKCEFENRKKASECSSTFSVYRKKNGFDIDIIRQNNIVYVRRRDKDADTQN